MPFGIQLGGLASWAMTACRWAVGGAALAGLVLGTIYAGPLGGICVAVVAAGGTIIGLLPILILARIGVELDHGEK